MAKTTEEMMWDAARGRWKMNTLTVEFDNETPDGTIRGLKISNADGTQAHYSKTWADTACHFALALGELADLRRQLAQAQEKLAAEAARKEQGE
jgi:hypothetical protein